MADTKKNEGVVWNGTNKEEVNKYLGELKVEGLSWNYVVNGNKTKLYIVQNGFERQIKVGQPVVVK